MALDSRTISKILKHESKRNTYKIALVRAINDIALEYSLLNHTAVGVAIPLRMIAEFWLAYYWAFVDETNPIRQGHDSTDMGFRGALTAFRQAWEMQGGEHSPSEGFMVKNVLAIKRKQSQYDASIIQQYRQTITTIEKAIQQPIKYAGTGEYTLFSKPQRLSTLHDVIPIPNAQPHDLCLVIPMALWQTFQDFSLWIEALCIHEWCMFTETIRQADGKGQTRGITYILLTARPDNRRPLTWERNQIDILLMGGAIFQCPWTHKTIRQNVKYEVDHLIPIAVRPMNELWNLIPTDPTFNLKKRDRLPSADNLAKARVPLIEAYRLYQHSEKLAPSLYDDSQSRFGLKPRDKFAEELCDLTCSFITSITEARNVAQF